MSGKIPNLKKLREAVEKTDVLKKTTAKPVQSTFAFAKAQAVPTGYELQLISDIQQDISSLQREVSQKEDELTLSSEDKLSNSFRFSEASEAPPADSYKQLLAEKEAKIQELEALVAQQRAELEFLQQNPSTANTDRSSKASRELHE